MKVKFERGWGQFASGTVHDLPDPVAQEHIRAGHARALTEFDSPAGQPPAGAGVTPPPSGPPPVSPAEAAGILPKAGPVTPTPPSPPAISPADAAGVRHETETPEDGDAAEDDDAEDDDAEADEAADPAKPRTPRTKKGKGKGKK